MYIITVECMDPPSPGENVSFHVGQLVGILTDPYLKGLVLPLWHRWKQLFKQLDVAKTSAGPYQNQQTKLYMLLRSYLVF